MLQPLYVAVYDGRSGAPLARFPADVRFDQAMALSPDGKLLAAAQRVPSGDGQNIDLVVDLYAIASNKRIARELHCRVPPGPPAESSWFGLMEFTSDGKYLLTSGYDRTKVWEVVV